MAQGQTSRRVWRWAVWTAISITFQVCNGTINGPVIGLCAREPKIRVDCYPPADNFPNVTEEACLAQGCCWKQLENGGIPCAFDALGRPDERHCAKISAASRFACRNPRFAVDDLVEDAAVCEEIGCCYDSDHGECFQPFFEGYELLTLDETDHGWRGTLVLRRFKRGPFGNDVALLELHVIKESASTVHIRITDPSFARFEVPSVVKESSESDRSHHKHKYDVYFYERPFGVAVTRQETQEVLFNSTPRTHASTSFNGLVFENQFLELSTHLEMHRDVGSPVLYGLGDRNDRARLRVRHDGGHYPLFARKVNEQGMSLGSVHPFYMQVLDSGSSHGVFFLSSNAMEIVTQQDALTFRATGGVLDFYIFTGPTTADVTNQFTKVAGRPAIPPVWALGYHFAKRGHATLNEAMVDVASLRLAGLPFDSYWLDNSYTYKGEAFTVDEHKFPLEETQAFVDDLHFNNQYLVLSASPTIPTEARSPEKADVQVVDDGENPLDCGSSDGSDADEISTASSSTYYPLARGAEMGVFVKGTKGEALAEKVVGSQWSAFVDFFHPNATSYWHEMLHNLYTQLLPFDGVWIEGSELSSSCDVAFGGRNTSCRFDITDNSAASVSFESVLPVIREAGSTSLKDGEFIRSTDVAFPFDPFRQPFVPGQDFTQTADPGNLNAGTLPMAAVHDQSLHYNLHSLYSRAHLKSTQQALDKILRRRTLAMSSSSYAGASQFSGYLLPETAPTWDSLRRSISDVIAMNLVGHSLVGARGVGGMSKELSIRWHQAASFFPLLVNQATDESSAGHFDQESANIIRDALLRRYRHLPYLYTQFFTAHERGQPLVRALAFEFPDEPLAFEVETQFMVGPGLMIAPVVEERVISNNVYLPNATWYELESGRRLIRSTTSDADRNRFDLVLAPLDSLPVFVRGGHIIPTQQASTTVAMTKRGVYTLVVALDTDAEEPSACGELFLDDGDSLHSVADRRYSLLAFEAQLNDRNVLEMKSQRLVDGYDGPEMHVDIGTIVVYGLGGGFHANSSLHIRSDHHDHDVKADYFQHASMLVISQLRASIGDELKLSIEARDHAAYEGDISASNDGQGTSRSAGSSGSADSEDAGDGDGAAEQHGGKKPAHGDDEGSKPVPITGEQHKGKKTITTIGIIGIVIGVIFVAGIFVVVLQRRRRGYNPIT